MIRFAGEEEAGGSGAASATAGPGDVLPPAGPAGSGAPLDFDGDAASDILVPNAEAGEFELRGLDGGLWVLASRPFPPGDSPVPIAATRPMLIRVATLGSVS